MHTSINFLIYLLKYKTHVVVEGVCRSGGHSFPKVAKQEEVQGKDNPQRVVGIVKAAELIVNRLDEKIVATFVCNLKPVYFLSSSYNSIKWLKKTKKV